MKMALLMTVAVVAMVVAAPVQARPLSFGRVTPGDQNTPLRQSSSQTREGVTLTNYGRVASDPGRDGTQIHLGRVTIDGTDTVTATPEPGSLILSGSALLLIGLTMKRAQKKTAQ